MNWKRPKNTSTEKFCFRCKVYKPFDRYTVQKCHKDGLESVCKECISKRLSERRFLRKRVYGKRVTNYKTRAQSAVRYELEMGRMFKPDNCSDCKQSFPKNKIHGHHKDYSKPLDVVWLCFRCHKEEHFRLNRLVKK